MGFRSYTSRSRFRLTPSAVGRRAVRAAVESLEDRRLFAVYAVADLGTPGALRSAGHDVNATGQVALDEDAPRGEDLSSHYHPALSAGATPVDLGTFGGDEGHAYGINAAGHVAGAADTGAAGAFHAFLYDGTAKQDLGTLGTGTFSTAYAVNDADVVVGSSETTAGTGTLHAFRSAGGTLTDLGTLAGSLEGATSEAFDVNNAGTIVGDATAADGNPHAFVYNGSGLTDLGKLAGGTFSSARSINASGQIVGEADLASRLVHAVLFGGTGGPTDLGTLPTFDTSTARGINAAGDVVGRAGGDGDPGARAFIYSGGQMRDLNALLTAGSGWVLNEAFSINDSGQITGLGTHDGQLRAFLLTPQQGTGDLPVEAAVTAPDITTAGGATQNISVSYPDLNNTFPIDPADITVSLEGGTPLTVLDATAESVNSSLVTAVYSVAAPGGSWDAADDGTYTITINSGAVANVNGTPFVGTGSFNVALGQFAGPTASVGPPGDFPAGATSGTIAVTYTDNTAVAAGSIGVNDIALVGPNGAVQVTGVALSPAADAASITATYTFTAPGGTFDAADSGTYTLVVGANQVFDADGNAAAATAGQFVVTVAPSPDAVDPSFGGGRVGADFVGEALVTDAAGRIYVAGHQGDLTAGSSQSVLRRFNADGTADATFGTNGSVVSPVGGNDAAYAIALDAQGRVYTAGTQGGDFIVNRFRADGTADPKYGSRGHAGTDMGGTDDTAYGLVVLADGSAVLGGGVGGMFVFAKFTANGTLDTTFGTGGRAGFQASTGASSADDVVGGLALDGQGRIVAAGKAGAGVAVVRLNPNGSLDTTFGGGNAITVSSLAVRSDLDRSDHTIGLAVQADNKILVANRTAGGDFAAARLNADGSLDGGFGTGGLVTADFGGDDDADAVVVQGTGQIFVVGTTDAGGPMTAVAAFTADGAVDTAFAAGGKFVTDAITTGLGRALHVGSLLLRAFAGLDPAGGLVVGTRDESPAAAVTPLRRLNVPGSGTVGQFGAVGGKAKKLAFLDNDGTRITLSLKGGTATAFFDGTSIDLVLTGTSGASTLTVAGKGGDSRVRLRDIRADGGLRAFSGKAADVTGTFFVNGPLGKVTLGSLTGTLAASGSIAGLSAGGNLIGAKVLAGANLGAGGQFGGTGSAADTFAAATLGKVAVRGSVAAAILEAGVDPANGTFADGDDVLLGGAASVLQSLAVRGGADATTRFLAGTFGKVAIPEKVDPADDARFRILVS